MEAQAQRPDLAADFATLESELMPYFRELDANALRLQNQFRLHQLIGEIKPMPPPPTTSSAG